MVSLSRQLAQWVVGLRYDDLLPEVIDRTKGVTLHSLASVLLGSQSRDGHTPRQPPLHWSSAIIRTLLVYDSVAVPVMCLHLHFAQWE